MKQFYLKKEVKHVITVIHLLELRTKIQICFFNEK